MANDAEKEKQESQDGGLNRRQFFVRLGLGSLAVAGAGTAVFAYQFLSPNVLYEPSPVVNAGKPASYPPESVTLDPATGIFVVRETQGFYALSAVCTHLGCTVNIGAGGTGFHCPCHGSQFDDNGSVVSGPAPKPLPSYAVSLSRDGRLVIDTSQQVPAS